ncbi:MAG: diacylglycerol kinase family lipid kinase [Bacillota bacterium]|nr:diacylglycerol kinase family lipid kinase [Bacillota bacterium]
MKNIYFIVNPQAGNGHCMKIWRKLEIKCKDLAVPYFVFYTEYRGHAEEIAALLASRNSGEEIMIAVGGDGTLHEVENGLKKMNSSISLGFIPAGSGNDFSRGFHIPPDPMEALHSIIRLLNQEGVCIDTGKILFENEKEHYFLNNMGAGFDALISYEVNHSKVKSILNRLSLGKLVYVYFLLKKLFTYQCTTVSLMIDGKKHIFKHTWFVTVSNQPFYGGGMKISPESNPVDGLLDITVVHQLSKLKLLFVFASVFSGKHTRFKEVSMFKGSLISIQSSSPLFVHADGEFIGHTPLKILVQPKTRRILTRMPSGSETNIKEGD